MTTAARIETLLAPPDAQQSRLYANKLVAEQLPKPILASKVAQYLAPLLAVEQSKHAALFAQLDDSTATTHTLLANGRRTAQDIQQRGTALKSAHEQLQASILEYRHTVVSSISQRSPHEPGSNTPTLREKLLALSERRKELESARDWFGVLAEAERLGLAVLRALEGMDIELGFDGYVNLVAYITSIHTTAPALAITTHLVGMASSVWTSLVKVLSDRLVQRVEALGWPTPLVQPLDWTSPLTVEFKSAFVDLLRFEKLQEKHALPIELKAKEKGDPATPILAIAPLVQPLILRFRWQFEGTRSTNRIDKPEYPLSHVLNLLSAHDRFMREDIQDLLDENGFAHVDAIVGFTSLLIPLLSTRLQHHIPQLLALPPIFAHTIYQTLEFDNVLRAKGYRPRGQKGEWLGLSQVILGKKDWFDSWVSGEREFFDGRYYAAISAPDAWQIVSEDDFDATDARSGVRPTNSALRVAELSDQLTDRYRPLPTVYTLPFLLTLHLPLLNAYASRVASSLDAFESLSFGLILPGALAEGRAATAGVGGVNRLVRAGVSAKWMGEKCLDWGDDTFFLVLHQYLQTNVVPQEFREAAQPLIKKEGTIFDGPRKTFEGLALRADELIVRHVVREVLGEMKAYLARRWEFAPPPADEELVLTPDLLSPLSLFTTLLTALVTSLPPSLATALYRRIASALSVALYDRLITNRTWSEEAGQQFAYDFEQGFLAVGRTARIQRGVERGWELLAGAAVIISLPASTSEGKKGEISFSKVMQLAFDDSVGVGEGSAWNEMLEGLGIDEEKLGKKEVQSVLRRRPECWR